jgi:16S rRNA (guanine527-N7)-methyltransferase
VTVEALDAKAGMALTPETIRALGSFADLAWKWTQKINLVAKSTQSEIWTRHIADSAQLWPLVPRSAKRFVDLGSGGGFPGLVLAILARQAHEGAEHVLVESDQRKAAFLREAARVVDIPVSVICARIEQVPPLSGDVVTARALAALPILLGYAVRHLAPDGVALFPKGAGYRAEIEAAREKWRFDLDVFPSQTDPEARQLRLSRIVGVTGAET